MIKKFLEWIKLKQKIHGYEHKPPLFKEGEIWWCSIGENVGSEINGKSNLFSRPVLIYKKLSQKTFLGIPTTTQERTGTWFVAIKQEKKKVTVVLNQTRMMDYRRLSNKVGQLDDEDLKKVKEAFKKLYC